jgi:hypothetical protein
MDIILILVGFYIVWWNGDDFNFATGSTMGPHQGWIILFGTLAADAISRGGGGKKGKGKRYKAM